MHCVQNRVLIFVPVGCNGGEEDSRQGSQSLHCIFGVRLPDQGGTLSGDDHHEWRRSQVTEPPETYSHLQAQIDTDKLPEAPIDMMPIPSPSF